MIERPIRQLTFVHGQGQISSHDSYIRRRKIQNDSEHIGKIHCQRQREDRGSESPCDIRPRYLTAARQSILAGSVVQSYIMIPFTKMSRSFSRHILVLIRFRYSKNKHKIYFLFDPFLIYIYLPLFSLVFPIITSNQIQILIYQK